MFNVQGATKCDRMASGETMPTEPTPLSQYILELLKNQNLSMREASMKAGLAPETISQIIRRGKTSTPRPDTLRLIASALGGSYQKMMILAGHMEEPPGFNGIKPEIREVVYELIEIWSELEELDPSGEALRELLTVVQTQAGAFRAALRAMERHERERRESPIRSGE